MKIVQMSDIHVGSYLFRPDLLSAVIEETNALSPDLVAVVGDLTTEGYRWEFEEAKGYLDRIECPNVVVAMGNHDSRSVGYRHFEELFGMREGATTVAVPEGEAKVVVLDSTKPDLDEGEVGREHYAWLDSEFRGWDRGPRVLVVHHHILAVPGTGRDVNILRDAGDVMAILRELRVDIVLSGHRHVPYVWSISGVRIVHSGTASSMRVRGLWLPSRERPLPPAGSSPSSTASSSTIDCRSLHHPQTNLPPVLPTTTPAAVRSDRLFGSQYAHPLAVCRPRSSSRGASRAVCVPETPPACPPRFRRRAA
jgi:Icc protein